MLGVAFHYLGVVGRAARRDHAHCQAQWDEVVRSHSRTFNPPPAYNFGVCIHGGVFVGRGWGRLSGANGTRSSNLTYWAIVALIGTEDEVTDALKIAMRDLAEQAPNVSSLDIKPHSYFIATSCPGPLHEWIAQGAPRFDSEEAELGAALDTIGFWMQEQRTMLENKLGVWMQEQRAGTVAELKQYIDAKLASMPSGPGPNLEEVRKVVADEVRRQLDDTVLGKKAA